MKKRRERTKRPMNEIVLVWMVLLLILILIRGVHIHVHHVLPQDREVVERMQKMELMLDKTNSELKTAVEKLKENT